jgi:sarcosine oxidase subunit gamma
VAENYLRRAALSHLGLAGRADRTPVGDLARAGVRLSERPHRCQILLRGNPEDDRFRDALRGTTGLALPAANRVSAKENLRLLWLAPDEFLLIGQAGREAIFLPSLEAALSGQRALALDVSDMRTTVSLAGPAARDLIACGCGLDLHPSRFATGQCAQTKLAKCNVVLDMASDEPRFDILVTVSYADYLWRWLERAGSEFGIAVEAG